jgi:hypothetical protein
MPTQQSTAGKGRAASPAREGGRPNAGAVTVTGERDEVYGLVSVLYHALQGAETYAQYVEDARRAGDDELSEFFEECQDEEADRADRAKELLATRLDAFAESAEADDDDDDDDDVDMEEGDEEGDKDDEKPTGKR